MGRESLRCFLGGQQKKYYSTSQIMPYIMYPASLVASQILQVGILDFYKFSVSVSTVKLKGNNSQVLSIQRWMQTQGLCVDLIVVVTISQ